MNTDTTKANWTKWIVGTVIALIGAAGGAVAVLEHLDAKRAAAESSYQQAIARWNAFTPRPIGQNERAEMLFGWYLDFDVGLVAMSLTGSSWDLRSELDLIFTRMAARSMLSALSGRACARTIMCSGRIWVSPTLVQ